MCVCVLSTFDIVQRERDRDRDRDRDRQTDRQTEHDSLLCGSSGIYVCEGVKQANVYSRQGTGIKLEFTSPFCVALRYFNANQRLLSKRCERETSSAQTVQSRIGIHAVFSYNQTCSLTCMVQA